MKTRIPRSRQCRLCGATIAADQVSCYRHFPARQPRDYALTRRQLAELRHCRACHAPLVEDLASGELVCRTTQCRLFRPEPDSRPEDADAPTTTP